MRPNFIGRTLVAILLWPMQCWQHCNSLILYPRGSARDPAGGSPTRPSEIATDNIQLSRVNFFQKIYLKFFKFFLNFFYQKKYFSKKIIFIKNTIKEFFWGLEKFWKNYFFWSSYSPSCFHRGDTHTHTFFLYSILRQFYLTNSVATQLHWSL